VTARRHRQAGFTLVEVMVGLLIMSIVAVALASAFLVGYRTITTEARQLSADQAVSTASLPLLRDFTSATTITSGTITPGSVPPLTITYGNPVTTVRYRIDARNNLIRTVVGGASTVAARGMQRVVVAAPAPPCYYTLTLTPSAIGAAAVTLNLSRRTGPQGCY
jgi:prepilin-type N-terminal cleavage/methylation domain-containing protein